MVQIIDGFDERLRAFSEMQRNWDGRGSTPPSPLAIATARYMTPVPGGDGSIQLEMHAGGMDIEIEIDPQGKVISVLAAPAVHKAR